MIDPEREEISRALRKIGHMTAEIADGLRRVDDRGTRPGELSKLVVYVEGMAEALLDEAHFLSTGQERRR